MRCNPASVGAYDSNQRQWKEPVENRRFTRPIVASTRKPHKRTVPYTVSGNSNQAVDDGPVFCIVDNGAMQGR
jgi:hypothetical protein